MPNQSDKPAPTLAETVALMTELDPAFRGVNVEAVRRDAADYYDNDLGRCGQFMVSRGTITADQLQLALARQAQIVGDDDRARSHLHKLRKDMHARAICLLSELGGIVATLAGRVS